MILKIPSNPIQTHSTIVIEKKKNWERNTNKDSSGLQKSSKTLSPVPQSSVWSADPSVQEHFTPSINAKKTSNFQPHLPNTLNK